MKLLGVSGEEAAASLEIISHAFRYYNTVHEGGTGSRLYLNQKVLA